MSDLIPLFRPKSVALIGASSDTKKYGYWTAKSLIDNKFQGEIHLISRSGGEILGQPTYPDILSVPGEVDLAIIAIAPKHILSIIEQCVEKGVKTGIVVSTGFGETGPEGKEIERRMLEIARKGNMRIMGPNCMGMYSSAVSLNASIIDLAPGDISSMYLTPDMTEAERQLITEKLGLDKSMPEQYWGWLTEALQGNFGVSLSYNTPVAPMLLRRLPSTILLMGVSLLVSLALAIPLGLIAGYKKNTWADNLISSFAYFGMSIPSFYFGMLMIILFTATLHWLPSSGMHSVGVDTPLDTLQHMIMPVLTMALGTMASKIRYVRANTIGQLSEEYVLASKAKGGPGADRDTLRAFHDALYEGYARDFGSRRNAMLRMKELWSYLIHLFRDPESYAKKLRKAADPAEFEALTAGMFRELELLPGLEPGFLF